MSFDIRIREYTPMLVTRLFPRIVPIPLGKLGSNPVHSLDRIKTTDTVELGP